MYPIGADPSSFDNAPAARQGRRSLGRRSLGRRSLNWRGEGALEVTDAPDLATIATYHRLIDSSRPKVMRALSSAPLSDVIEALPGSRRRVARRIVARRAGAEWLERPMFGVAFALGTRVVDVRPLRRVVLQLPPLGSFIGRGAAPGSTPAGEPGAPGLRRSGRAGRFFAVMELMPDGGATRLRLTLATDAAHVRSRALERAGSRLVRGGFVAACSAWLTAADNLPSTRQPPSAAPALGSPPEEQAER